MGDAPPSARYEQQQQPFQTGSEQSQGAASSQRSPLHWWAKHRPHQSKRSLYEDCVPLCQPNVAHVVARPLTRDAHASSGASKQACNLRLGHAHASGLGASCGRRSQGTVVGVCADPLQLLFEWGLTAKQHQPPCINLQSMTLSSPHSVSCMVASFERMEAADMMQP